MSKSTKPSYIAVELEWLESQIKVLKEQVEYILSNLEDRYGPKELPNGRVVNAIISSKEDQIKTATMVMEKLPKMLYALDELREKEANKVESRGKGQISALASDFLESRTK